ncbi:Uncharacterized protein FKW44_002747 [Caligus rogercresseyi]|uniref:Uncharacterized protein n=1 Tax=Caligus rogercresseyi TaxID=217165 RepID=A0A7T8KKL9_CALRO|nr:Uncharacterized protein FKW44_002747 [Caligus rogercresseyi]
MKSDEGSNHVRLAATNALFNSLEFTRANFDKEVSNGKDTRDIHECKSHSSRKITHLPYADMGTTIDY